MNLTISQLRYVTIDGLEAPVDRSDPDCPFHGPGRTEHGQRVANAFIRELRWDTSGVQRQLKFNGGIIAAVDPKSGQIVVKVSANDLPEPNNAIVVNPDASVNHQVKVPPYVERTIEHLPGKEPVIQRCSVECIDEVLIQDHCLIFGLGFAYEWIERRRYDAVQRQWGEPTLVYRR